VLCAADVHGSCTLRIGLGAVDVCPRGGVQDEIELAERGRRHRHVPVGMRQATRAGERLEQRGAELPARAGYDDASRAERIGDDVLQMCRTRSSFHGMLCSSGAVASYSSVTRYMNRQSVSASYPCAWTPGT
jgi:hypothetical protein